MKRTICFIVTFCIIFLSFAIVSSAKEDYTQKTYVQNALILCLDHYTDSKSLFDQSAKSIHGVYLSACELMMEEPSEEKINAQLENEGYLKYYVIVSGMFWNVPRAIAVLSKYDDVISVEPYYMSYPAKEHTLVFQNGMDEYYAYSVILNTKDELNISDDINELYGVYITDIEKIEYNGNNGYFYRVSLDDAWTVKEAISKFSQNDNILSAQADLVNDPGLLGDVNKNGTIDITDYILIKRTYFGSFKDLSNSVGLLQLALGDLNLNGKIDMTDYILLKRMYFGTWSLENGATADEINPDDTV